MKAIVLGLALSGAGLLGDTVCTTGSCVAKPLAKVKEFVGKENRLEVFVNRNRERRFRLLQLEREVKVKRQRRRIRIAR